MSLIAHRLRGGFSICIFTFGLVGCTVLGTTPDNQRALEEGAAGATINAQRKLSGQAYYLPRGLLRAKLVDAGGGAFRLEIGDPTFVADTREPPHLLSYYGSPTSNDEVSFGVNEHSLLTSIKADVDDQTDAIIIAAAKSAAAVALLEAGSDAPAMAETVVFDYAGFDPTDKQGVKAINAKLGTTLDAYIQQQLTVCKATRTTSAARSAEVAASAAAAESAKTEGEAKASAKNSGAAKVTADKATKVADIAAIRKATSAAKTSADSTARTASAAHKQAAEAKKQLAKLAAAAKAAATCSHFARLASLDKPLIEIEHASCPDNSHAAISPPCDKGICYRPPIPIAVGASASGTTYGSTFFSLPNCGPTVAMEISRALAVQKVTNLTIENGMLRGVDIVKPSELLAIAKVPLDVVKAILSVPGELFAVQQSSVDAQTQLIQSQTELIKAEKALADVVGVELESATLANQRLVLHFGAAPPKRSGVMQDAGPGKVQAAAGSQSPPRATGSGGASGSAGSAGSSGSTGEREQP